MDRPIIGNTPRLFPSCQDLNSRTSTTIFAWTAHFLATCGPQTTGPGLNGPQGRGPDPSSLGQGPQKLRQSSPPPRG